MPEDPKTDDVEKFLSEQKSLESRKQALIEDLLRQREAAIKAFDEKLEKLGYRGNSRSPSRSHHKKAAPDASAGTKTKTKS